MISSPAPLLEISERDAGEAIAPLYDDIRARLGVRTVPLFYRVLAAEPRCLAWAWQILAPCASSGVLDHIGLAARRATQLRARMPPRAACRLAGLDDAAAQAAWAVVSAFNNANPLNLAALLIIEAAQRSGLVPRADHFPSVVPPAPIPLLLPPRDDISDDARALIDFLTSCGFRHEVAAIPTLWRALAAYPPALALAAVALAADFETGGRIDQEARAIDEAARGALSALPMTQAPLPCPDAAAHLARLAPFFAETIPTMIAIGARLLPLFDEDRRP